MRDDSRMTTQPESVSWPDRAVLSIKTAAGVLDRNETWVRSQIVAGHLDAVQLTPGGELVVRTESIRRLVESAKPPTKAQIAALRRRLKHGKRGSHLRLVADNT
jgi:hypothetical protein